MTTQSHRVYLTAPNGGFTSLYRNCAKMVVLQGFAVTAPTGGSTRPYRNCAKWWIHKTLP